MNKSKSLLLLGAAAVTLGFASCQQEGAGAASQATIDSMVNVKVDSFKTALMSQNDSLINALAYQKADSIVTAMKATNNGKVPTSVPAPPKHNTPISNNKISTQKPQVAAPEPTKPGGLKGHSDQSKTNSGGLKSHSDQAKQSSGKTGGGLRSHSDQNKNK